MFSRSVRLVEAYRWHVNYPATLRSARDLLSYCVDKASVPGRLHDEVGDTVSPRQMCSVHGAVYSSLLRILCRSDFLCVCAHACV